MTGGENGSIAPMLDGLSVGDLIIAKNPWGIGPKDEELSDGTKLSYMRYQDIAAVVAGSGVVTEEVMSQIKNLGREYVVQIEGQVIERHAKKLPRFTDIYWNEFNMITENHMNNNLEVSIFNHIDSLRYRKDGHENCDWQQTSTNYYAN